MLNPNTLSLPSMKVHNKLPTQETRPEMRAESETGRKKIILGKGFSLMDWIRYSKITPNIAGNNGIMSQISYEEMDKHSTKDDCWMAVYDKVYNVTPYMKFHPGGIDELMKGAGLNATDLFNDVHPWVNYQSMLEKCLIGNLVGKPIKEDSSKSTISLITDNMVLKNIIEPISEVTPPAPPVIDSYQTVDEINIVIYTKCKNMHSDNLIVDQVCSRLDDDFKILVIFIYLKDNQVHKFSTELNFPIKNDYSVKVSKEGKVELILKKIKNTAWDQMKSKINFQHEFIENSQTGTNYRVCELTKRIEATYDTDLYVFDLPKGTRMFVPLGHHVFLKFHNSPDDYPIKPYTVINGSLFDSDNMMLDGKKIYLMIKHYVDGYFTSKIRNLDIGSKIEISNFTGSFDSSKLLNCKELVLICAGSGFTPMVRLLDEAVKIDSIKNIILLFFNKRSKDILWEKELKKFETQYANKLSITHVLSTPGINWQGKTGRITNELFKELCVDKVTQPLFCVCGPKPFSDITLEFIRQNGYKEESMHPFFG